MEKKIVNTVTAARVKSKATSPAWWWFELWWMTIFLLMISKN
jgi:hypothetical protein